jgi:hypothetical protein
MHQGLASKADPRGGCFMEDTPQTREIDVVLSLEAAEGNRWRIRVELRPLAPPIAILGATVAILDIADQMLGPAVVLALPDEIQELTTVLARVPAPARGQHPATVRATLFLTDRSTPIVVERPIERPIHFGAYMLGEGALGLGTPPPGRTLGETERRNLRQACPWLGLDESEEAFDAFSKDFVDACDLGVDKDVTEEILRLLREDV